METPELYGSIEAIIHCHSSTSRRSCQACHQHWCVCVCLCEAESDQPPDPSPLRFCCSFPNQQPFGFVAERPCVVPLWQLDPSQTLPPSPPSSLTSFSLPSPPSQALGREGTASALQTQGQKLPAGSHGNSFSLTRHFPAR